MPANTNPLPGVYVPPPPDIPAWTQRQHAPLAPAVKKFTYTKPEVHPSFQQGAYAPNTSTLPPNPQYYQQGQQPQGQQQSSGYPPPLPQSQFPAVQQQISEPAVSGDWSGQTPAHQSQFGSVQPMQQYEQTPSPNFGSKPQYQNEQQYTQAQIPNTMPRIDATTQAYSQGQQPPGLVSSYPSQQSRIAQPSQEQPGAYSHNITQTPQLPRKVPASIGAQSHQDFSTSAQTTAPVSPVQSRPGLTLSQAIERSENLHKEQHRQPVIGQPVAPASIAGSSPKPSIANPVWSGGTSGASVLGIGGPSDWEHYGALAEDDEDEAAPLTAIPGSAKSSSNPSDRVELPSHPSPPPLPAPHARDQSYSSAVSVISEDWPTPPAPAPLNVRRPESGFQYKVPPAQERFVATPPLRTSTPRQITPQRGFAQGTVSHTISASPNHILEGHGGITPPISSSPVSWTGRGPRDTMTTPKPPETTGNIVIDDGGWLPQEQNSPKQNKQQAHQQSSSADLEGLKIESSAPTATQFVMDAGFDVVQGQIGEQHPPPSSREATDLPAAAPVQSPAPLSDLDPWYRASLDRYTKMLYNEAGAASIEEKIKVFTSFVTAESLIRGIDLHGACSPVQTNERPGETGPSPEPEQKIEAQRPAAHEVMEPQRAPIRSQTLEASSTVFDDAVQEYSPGGRPIVSRPQRPPQRVPEIGVPKPHQLAKSLTAQSPPSTGAKPLEPTSPKSDNGALRPGSGTPSVSGYKAYKSNATPASESEPSPRSVVMTPSSSPGADTKAVPAQPPTTEAQPDYKPFAPHQRTFSVTEPVSDKRRLSLGTAVVPGRKEHAELFVDGPVSSVKPIPPTITKSPDKPAPAVASPPLSALDKLSAMLQGTDPQTKPRSFPQLQRIEAQVSILPADFAHLEAIQKTWESSAAKIRNRLDEERNRRQEESERHTDEIFNSNEIGYQDIGMIERKFREEEEARRAQEAMEEYKSYEANVFNAIYNSLQDEIRRLMELYVDCVGYLRASAAGKAALEHDPAKPPIIPTMELLLSLHRRIEARHQRVAKAVVDRNRRYKRTALQPLYAAGKVAEMKTMERHFDMSERKDAVRTAQDRVERTRRLMELVDECVARAIDEGRDCIDIIVRHLDQIKAEIPQSEQASGAGKGPQGKQSREQTLKRAVAAVRALTADLVAVLRHFQEVETALGDAEYEADVAKARLDEAQPAAVRKLEELRKAADLKLRGELDRKVFAVEQDLHDAERLVEELLR